MRSAFFCNRSRIHIKAALRHRAFPSSQPHRKMQRDLGCLYRAGRVQNRFFLCKSTRFHGEAGTLCFAKLLLFRQTFGSFSYLRLSATATATATVAPTMGLLPIEIRRFIRQKTIVLFCFCSTFERFLHSLFSFLFHFSLQSYYFFATVDTRLTNQHFSTALDKCNSKDILLLSLQFLVL